MYILEEDRKVIEDWAKRKNISISFRAAGEYTLECLKRGAGAKPHEILDKTLKYKSEEENGAERHNAMVKTFMEGFGNNPVGDLLMGLVGHWTQDCIDGIYLTDLGEKTFPNSQYSIERNSNGKPYLLLADPTRRENLIKYYQTLCEEKGNEKAEYFFSRLFFSGDYDVHDMLQAGWPVPTQTDMMHIQELQRDLLDARKRYLKDTYGISKEEFQEEKSEDYQRVQHGPQANYSAQMINENRLCKTVEELNVLVEGVAVMSPPVMVYDAKATGCQWGILGTDKDIVKYYELKGNAVKSTWREPVKREQMIRWTIKNAIQLIYFDKGKKEINYGELLDQLPNFEEVYGGKLSDYVRETLEEMVATKELYKKGEDIYVKL